MSDGALELKVVRESLEGLVAPEVAASLLFEALSALGELPSSGQGIRALVDGPLRALLCHQLGDDAGTDAVDQILSRLGGAQQLRSGRDQDITKNVALSTDAVVVLLVSGSRAFLERLLATLGPGHVAPVYASSLDELAKRAARLPPAIIIVDAADFPAIEPAELAGTLGTLPPDAVRAIWGVDLPYGMALLAATQRLKLATTPLDRKEGIAPLVDLVRSRRA